MKTLIILPCRYFKELQKFMKNMVCWTMTHIQMNGYFIHCYVASFLHDGFNCWMASGVTIRCAWPGRGESVAELMPLTNFLIHSYTCCSDRHASPYWNSIRQWVSLLHYLKKGWQRRCSSLVHVTSGAANTTAPSCCIPSSYCHLSATLQTMSIIFVNLQDNRTLFRIFMELLRFYFYSPRMRIP